MTLARYRNALPQLGGEILLTDGGIETTLVFHRGLELPHFAAFGLLRATWAGRSLPVTTHLCRDRRARRARPGPRNRDLAVESRLGHDPRLFARGARRDQRRGGRLHRAIRDAAETPAAPVVLNGVLGPRGDGYAPERHDRRGGRGVSRRAGPGVRRRRRRHGLRDHHELSRGSHGHGPSGQAAGMPVAVSFTVETDGRLPPAGARRRDRACDAATGRLSRVLHDQLRASERISATAGRRRLAGADRRHPGKRLEDEPRRARRGRELDAGDPEELGRDYLELMRLLPNLRVLGGCCGTDHRHIGAISRACRDHAHAA